MAAGLLPGAPFGGYKMSAYSRVPAIQQMKKYLNVKAFDQDSIGKRRGGFPVKPPANSAQGHATPRLTLRINFNKDSAIGRQKHVYSLTPRLNISVAGRHLESKPLHTSLQTAHDDAHRPCSLFIFVKASGSVTSLTAGMVRCRRWAP